MRELRYHTDVIIKNFDNYNKTNKKVRDVQHHFNTKAESDAYINIKVEECRK